MYNYRIINVWFVLQIYVCGFWHCLPRWSPAFAVWSPHVNSEPVYWKTALLLASPLITVHPRSSWLFTVSSIFICIPWRTFTHLHSNKSTGNVSVSEDDLLYSTVFDITLTHLQQKNFKSTKNLISIKRYSRNQKKKL